MNAIDARLDTIRIGRRSLVAAGAAALASIGFPCLTHAAVPLSQLINRSGKMRALSQRASKFYVQIALGVLPDKASESLNATQRTIASVLESLIASNPPPEVRKPLSQLERDVAMLGTLLGGTPRLAEVAAVAKAADAMLDSANQSTTAFQETTKQSAARIVNLSGRQRMLSQRAARAYFMSAAGQDNASTQKQLGDAREEFKQALATLAAAPISTASIKNELELARSQWVFYEAALTRKPNGEGLTVVATTSERIYEAMDNLTSLYEAALRDLIA